AGLAPGRPSDPPRPITPAAERRSWREQRVRVWWLLAVALAGMLLLFSAQQVIEGRRIQSLIDNGEFVKARITDINGTKRESYIVSQEDHYPVTLQFTLTSGQTPEVRGHPAVQ